MNFDLPQVNQLLLNYGYFVLFPLVVIEGPIITIIAGFFLSLAQLNFWIVYPVVIAGDLTGDVLYYLLGRLGHGSFIVRWGRFFGITPNRIDRLKVHFSSHAGKTLAVGKLSHGIGAAFLVAAGMAGMPLSKFIWYNFLGTVPKSLILLAIGYFFGQAIGRISSILDWLAVIFLGLGVIFILWYIFYYRSHHE